MAGRALDPRIPGEGVDQLAEGVSRETLAPKRTPVSFWSSYADYCAGGVHRFMILLRFRLRV